MLRVLIFQQVTALKKERHYSRTSIELSGLRSAILGEAIQAGLGLMPRSVR